MSFFYNNYTQNIKSQERNHKINLWKYKMWEKNRTEKGDKKKM